MGAFTIDLSGVPPEKKEKVQDAIDDLFMEWTMEGGIPEDADDIIFEKITSIIEEDDNE